MAGTRRARARPPGADCDKSEGVSLRAVRKVASVCESILFGVPSQLVPTTDGRLDWDEIEGHRRAFRALAEALAEQVRVCPECGEEEGRRVGTRYGRDRPRMQRVALVFENTARKPKSGIRLPAGHFLVISGGQGTGTLLIKVT